MGQTGTPANNQWNSDMTKPYMTKCSCRTSGDSSPHFCRPIFRSRPSWFQEYFLATPPPSPPHTHTHTHTLPLTDIKFDVRHSLYMKPRWLNGELDFFQSHFVFRWNCAQKEFVLRVWIVPGKSRGSMADRLPVDRRWSRIRFGHWVYQNGVHLVSLTLKR